MRSSPERGRIVLQLCASIFSLFVFTMALPNHASAQSAGRDSMELASHTAIAEPFRVVGPAAGADAIEVVLEQMAFAHLRSGAARVRIRLPVPSGDSILLELERFDVVSRTGRFVVQTEAGVVESASPQVVTFRGRMVDAPHSKVYLALSGNGMANGYVERDGGTLYVSTARPAAGPRAGQPVTTIHEHTAAFSLPEFATFCGVEGAEQIVDELANPRGSTTDVRGPRIAKVAIEGDQAYVNLFDNVSDAQTYIVQLVGAVSDIYIRDLNVKLVLEFSRVWPMGGEPFTATDIYTLLYYYWDFEPWWEYHYVHLFSGRRDTGYGGVAFVGGTCQGYAHGISAFLLGSFPSPLGEPHLGNWDVIVVAHEMGHNSGTYHTHDGYNPPIDQCGNGIPARSEIMSYCHIHPGGTTNTDLRFHRRVQDVVENTLQMGACFTYDCNNNGVDDYEDILLGTSLDLNFNEVPDECEDCNGNSILDEDDIYLGPSNDENFNGIPDECEPDCNGNGIPDAWECDLNPAIDQNGNNIPDECEPDCDGNGIPDFIDIRDGLHTDVDRNWVPDVCQDCDGSGVADWIELGRGENLFVADRAGYVREYYRTTGVPVGNRAAGQVSDPHDLVFGPDRQLYVASYGDDRVVRIDVDNGAVSTFVSAGSGGLDGPSGLIFGPGGNLFVVGRLSQAVYEYDGATGAFVSVFAADFAGAGAQPFGLTFDDGGDMYVTCSNHSVRRYDSSGALVSEFVTPGSGGLSAPRGLAFHPNGNLLVTSSGNNRVLEYDGASGAFVRIYNQTVSTGSAWGIRTGPQNTIYVVQSVSQTRVFEYAQSGLFLRSYVRGDGGLPTPTGIAFRPGFVNDCNSNRVLDRCDSEWTDVGLFVGTLLAEPPDEVLVCIYDRNGDGLLDGLDIAAFLDDLLP